MKKLLIFLLLMPGTFTALFVTAAGLYQLLQTSNVAAVILSLVFLGLFGGLAYVALKKD